MLARMAPQLDQLVKDQQKAKTILQQMTALDAKAFEGGNFALIAHGLGAKYGKKPAKVEDSGRMPSSSLRTEGRDVLVDVVDGSTQEAEQSFLSDYGGPKCLHSSMIRSASHNTTPASSINEMKVDTKSASPLPVAQKPSLDITYYPGDNVDFHFITAPASQMKCEGSKKQREAKENPANPNVKAAAKNDQAKPTTQMKKSYASVLQQGNARQQMQSAPQEAVPLQCPPDLTYASYGASKRLEERQNTVKLGLCDESLAALEGKSRFTPGEAPRVYEIFEKSTQVATRAAPNLLRSGLLPDGKGYAMDARCKRDVEAVLASQWNSKSTKINAIHRAAAQLVDKELALAPTGPKNKIHQSGTNMQPHGDTVVASGKMTTTKHRTNEPVKEVKSPKDRFLAAGKPQSMRASDGASCIECMELPKPQRGTTADSVINPLKDVKAWSVKYFQKRDPTIAEQLAAFENMRKPESSPDGSQTDTRDLDEARSVLIPRAHHSSRIVLEWMVFTGQHPQQRRYDPRPNVEIRAQLSSWDGDLKALGKAQLENACWSLGQTSAMSVDRWIDFNVDIKNQYSMDEQSPDFQSGASRPSGLLINRLVHPPDFLCEYLEPDFSAIDWTKNVTYPPHDRDRLSPFQLLQSSELCRQITLAPYLEKVAEVELLREKAEKKVSCADENVNTDRQENPWVPQANFYVRPARRIDIPQLVELHNEWIRDSVFTKHETLLRDGDFLEDFEQRKRTGLPFLVAATKSSLRGHGAQQMGTPAHAQQARGRRSQRLSVQQARGEKIIGIVFAETYKDTKNIFRGILEVKLFVSPACVRLGVGKTLLDRIMAYTDPMYDPKRGTHFEYNEREDNIAYKLGPPNKIRKVLVDVLYSSDQPQDFTWKKEMLETKFGFHQAGFFLNFAERDGKPINMATFMRESFNAAGNQSMMYPGQLKEIEGIFSPKAVRHDERLMA